MPAHTGTRLQVEAKGVVLFLHGFEQYPQDYATVLCGLAEEGLNIVAPVMSRASGDLNLVMPAKLQAADLEDVKTVIKALFDKNSNTLRKYVPKASPNRVVALAGHSLGGEWVSQACQQRE